MCLTKTSRFRKTAKQDITVYKVVRRLEDKGQVQALYNFIYYLIGKAYKTTIGTSFWTKEVDQGYHSYNTLPSAQRAMREAADYDRGGEYGVCIVECTIPKGSKYYVGNNPDDSDGRVSNQIIINKIL